MTEQLTNIDGLTDAEVVAALREGKLGKLAAERATSQLTREDIEGMTPQQIHEATVHGRVRDLLAGKES